MNGRYFAGTGSSGVYWSKDKGATWKFIGPEPSSVRAITPFGNMVVAALYDKNVFRSRDMDSPYWDENAPEINWDKISSGLTSLRVSTLASRGTILYAGTETKGVFRSLDSGKIWTPANNGLKSTIITHILPVGPLLYAATGDQGVFLSTDSAKSWSEVNNGIAEKAIYALALSVGEQKQGKLLAATSVSGVLAGGGISLVSIRSDGTHFGVMRGTVYPNPVRERLTIDVGVEPNSTIFIRCYSATGSLVWEQIKHSASSVFKQSIDMSGAPPGMFFVVVHDATTMLIQKITVE